MATDVIVSKLPFHAGITLAATTYKSLHSNSNINRSVKKATTKNRRRKGTRKPLSKSSESVTRKGSNSIDNGNNCEIIYQSGEETLHSESSIEVIDVNKGQETIKSAKSKGRLISRGIKSATKDPRENRKSSKKHKTKLKLTNRIKTVQNFTDINSNDIKIKIQKITKGISDLHTSQLKTKDYGIKSNINSTITLPQIPKVIQASNASGKKLPQSRIYLSEKQSKGLHEGISAAPPCTPENEFAKNFLYIPSLSDIRSQRAIKNRLIKLQKIYNEKEEKEKMRQLQSEENTKKKSKINSTNQLKSWQRMQESNL
ncbi:uncharacterized protein TRIADDRAFT_57686 [Trichoplax adhaerens]|uniref:Small vasohibin-binding protein n=1 Tax=Trichoplax adhaerens TaxID=10228 RepID=B3S051_TRIAD|nr:predicted protein [Trichoplax adhaerens]EDV23943.1 predicted protein [Trichoplax adhaerens]|eukprot:XP_002113469.1 predicted protein [Trichoplax adhaerens]